MNLYLLLTSLILGNSTLDLNAIREEEIVEDRSVKVIEDQGLEIYEKWYDYKTEFQKNYDNVEEDFRRMRIFAENEKLIEEHNKLYRQKYYTFELGHNQFSDITHEEYLEFYTSYQGPEAYYDTEYPTVKPPVDREQPYAYELEQSYNKDPTVMNIEEESYLDFEDADKEITVKTPFSGEDDSASDDIVEQSDQENDMELSFIPPENVQLPLSVDWRKKGAVTSVKDEGKCGASWAFAAVGALEGQLFRLSRHLAALSEQNVVDCSDKFGNKGCKNGTAANAYKYILHNHGIDRNHTYPWKGKKQWRCHYKKLPGNPTIHGVHLLKRNNETNLQVAVATQGPIAVAIDARSNKFKFYKNGIFRQSGCSSNVLNREMVLVGYGQGFWILKNSWGKKWGAGGYIYLAKTGKNMCGIASRATFPSV